MSRPKRGQAELTLTKTDIGNLVNLAAELDPDDYDSPVIKALLYRIEATRLATEKSPYTSYFLWMDER
jgi:hypothetical protein